MLGNGRTLFDYVETYDLERGLRPKTRTQYEQAVKCLGRWLGRPVALSDLCDDLVNRYLRDLEATPMAPATIRCRRTHLLALWRSAAQSLLCAEPRRIRKVKVPRRPATAWTADEVRRLVTRAAKMTSRYDRIGLRKAVYWDLAVRLGWDTGFRNGDLWRVEFGDFETAGMVEIVQSKTSRWHIRPLKPSTIRAIHASRPPEREHVVPWPYAEEYFRQEFRLLAFGAGLDGSFKKIRKSGATNVDIRYPGYGAIYLGHGPGNSVARDSYLDPRIMAPQIPSPEEL